MRHGTTATVVFENAGMNFDTGSLSRMSPLSTSIMMATDVTAFDIEAIRKIVSVVIGTCCSRSAMP